MRIRRITLLLAVALTAVFAAGCGGDDDDSDSTTTATVAASTAAAGGDSAQATSEAAEASAPDEATSAADTGGPDTAIMTDTAAGDTGADTAAADVSPEKAAFIEQADAICKEANDKITALGSPASAEELPDFLAKGVDIQQEQTDKLKGLTPPAEDADWWNETLGLLDQLNAVTTELRDKAKAGASEDELNALADKGTPINDELNSRAEEYGLKVCGT
jgi:hypothetical protein